MLCYLCCFYEVSHYDAVTAFEMTYFDVIDDVADCYRTNLVQMNVL